MKIELIATTPLPLQQQTQWIWFSEKPQSFIVGDESAAFALAVANPATPVALTAPARGAASACNLPLPTAVCDELLAEPWHGFGLLSRAEYERNPDGDLLRTLVFGPNYGTYVRHPASGLFLSLRSGAIELLKRDGDGFKVIEKTKSRGKASLAFAAHPGETLLAYGDNFGVFHLQSFDESGFGKASKIADKSRNANRVEFVRDGSLLVVGGMGYLATFSYADGKTAAVHETSTSVRDFAWREDGKRIVVNHGLNGISAYRYGEGGFERLGDVKPAGPVNQIAVSRDACWIGVTRQDCADVTVYSADFDG